MLRIFRFLVVFLLIALVLSSTGCPWKRAPKETGPKPWKNVIPGTKFHLLVVDDPEIAKKLRQLVTVWEEISRSSLTISEMTALELMTGPETTGKELSQTDLSHVDAVIAPLELEGILLQKNFPGVIQTDAKNFPKADWNDLFDLQKTQMTRSGTDVKMVPLGSRFYVCYYRADLLEKIGEQPPKTWGDYLRLCEQIGQANPEMTVSLEPTAEGWAAKSFLSRAASYATHRDFYSVLFDLNTMEPLVNTEPFVRTLQEMKTANPTPHSLTPFQVRNAFWEGKCAFALTFPSAVPVSEITTSSEVLAGIAVLPGYSKSFNPRSKAWDSRLSDEQNHIPTMVSGRFAMIAVGSSSPEGTLDLLLWLSGEEWGTDVLSVSEAVGISRKSQLRKPSLWVEKQMVPKVMSQYVSVLSKQMAGSDVLVVPSLPGQDEYMQVLDKSIRQVLAGTAEPQQALDAVAVQWKQITEKYGLESQKNLYRQSCGLSTR